MNKTHFATYTQYVLIRQLFAFVPYRFCTQDTPTLMKEVKRAVHFENVLFPEPVYCTIDNKHVTVGNSARPSLLPQSQTRNQNKNKGGSSTRGDTTSFYSNERQKQDWTPPHQVVSIPKDNRLKCSTFQNRELFHGMDQQRGHHSSFENRSLFPAMAEHRGHYPQPQMKPQQQRGQYRFAPASPFPHRGYQQEVSGSELHGIASNSSERLTISVPPVRGAVCVCHLRDPEHFYVQTKEFFLNFDKMMEECSAEGQKAKSPCDVLVNKVYLINFKKNWYRGKILSKVLLTGNYTVLFIDNGTEQTIPENR